MKTIIVNLTIQLLWVVVALFIGYWLASTIFDALLWRCIFSAIFSVLAYFLMMWLTATFKALKDPDVQIASELRMSVKRYRHYQRLYDEYQEFMAEHGVHSHASEEKFKEIFKQIEIPNEWRRYCAYREEKSRNELRNELLGL